MTFPPVISEETCFFIHLTLWFDLQLASELTSLLSYLLSPLFVLSLVFCPVRMLSSSAALWHLLSAVTWSGNWVTCSGPLSSCFILSASHCFSIPFGVFFSSFTLFFQLLLYYNISFFLSPHYSNFKKIYWMYISRFLSVSHSCLSYLNQGSALQPTHTVSINLFIQTSIGWMDGIIRTSWHNGPVAHCEESITKHKHV